MRQVYPDSTAGTAGGNRPATGEPSGTLRTAAERAALPVATGYAAAHDLVEPPSAALFEVLPGARRSILHRLIGCLVREAPSELASPIVTSATDRDSLEDVLEGIPGPNVDGIGGALAALPDGARWIAVAPFPTAGEVLLGSISAISSYDRIHLTGPAVAWSAEASRRIEHPVDVVSLFEAEGAFVDAVAAYRFRSELAESVANLALARLAARVLAREAIETRDENPLVDLAPHGADITAALERLAAIEERPTNPSAKIRRGMAVADAPRYAPEFTDRVDVRFVAIDPDSAYRSRIRTSGGLTAELYAQFPALEEAVQRVLPAGSTAGEPVCVPVHPWQFHRTLPRRFATEIADGTVTLVPDFAVPATPLLNLRTVVPLSSNAAGEHPLHLKLPIDVKKTNHVRTLPTEEVHNGPAVSDLLESLLQEESLGAFGVLADRAAAGYRPHDDGPANPGPEATPAQLGGLARTNPYTHPLVSDDAIPVAAASLLAVPADAGPPLVCRCIERFADTTALPDEATAARRFVEAYVDVIVPAQLWLTCKYGVALETHLQNTIVIVGSDCRLTGVLVRDFGGIRVLDDRLESQGWTLETYPDSDIDAADPRDLYLKTIHTFYQQNLDEFIKTIANHTAATETDCWDIVRQRTRRTFDSLREDDCVPPEPVNRDETALFADSSIHGSRISMRLRELDSKPYKRSVRNPLAEPSRAIGD